MGTNIYVDIYGYENSDILIEIENLLDRYNLIFSMYDEDSELYALNKTAYYKKFHASNDLFNLIKIGKNNSIDGNLNILVGPIVKLWNIGFDNAKLPSDNEIKEILPLVNVNNLVLDSNTNSISFLLEGMSIDLGALAKGYIADMLIDYLKNKNVLSAVVNLGGNIKTFGFAFHQKDLNFHFGIQNPTKKRGNHILYLNLIDKSIVTSGIYERNLMVNDKFYHHIFNPKNGYPIKSDVLSLTIISNSSLDGEIYTSKLFGKNASFIDSYLKYKDDINFILIQENNQVTYSKGVEKYLLKGNIWKIF